MGGWRVVGGRRPVALVTPPVTIVLTRPAGRSEALQARLEAARPGAFAFVVEPLVEIEPIEGGPVELSPYDWVVVTSATGALELAARAVGEPRRVAAIGAATANAWPGPVDLIAAVSTQEGLLAELPRPAGRVLFAGAEASRSLLVDELGAEFLPLYRTRPRRPAQPLRGDLVVLTSGSAARAYGALGLEIAAVSIGPETTRAAEEAGVRVVGEAPTHDLDGLVRAVLDATR